MSKIVNTISTPDFDPEERFEEPEVDVARTSTRAIVLLISITQELTPLTGTAIDLTEGKFAVRSEGFQVDAPKT